MRPPPCAGLAERSADGRRLLHPAVAQASRDLDREVRDGTVRSLYAIRNHLYQMAVNDPGASQETLGHYVASTVPYLMRLGFWEQASAACELAITHDQSPAMAGRLLPYDIEIVRAANGTRLEPAATFVYASLLRPLDEDRSLKVLTRLHDQAVKDDDDDEMTMVTASSIATLLTLKDPQRAHEYLTLAQASRTAAGQPWCGVRLQNIEAEIRYQLGDWAGALAQAQDALDQLDRLAAAGTTPQGVNPHAEPGDTGDQGLILIQLARLEHRRGHHDDAIALGRRALRASYAAAERLDAAAAHSSMANFLAATPGRAAEEAPVHVLAAAVIHMRMSQELLAITPQVPALRALGRLTCCLARQPQLIPGTFEELRHKLAESTGVEIAVLLNGLDRVPVSVDPGSGRISFSRNPLGTEEPGDSVTDALCWAMHRPAPDELTDVGGHADHWQPLIDAVSTAARDRNVQASLRDVLDDYRGARWGTLADALDAFMAEPETFRPPPALPDAELNIVQRIMHASHGIRRGEMDAARVNTGSDESPGRLPLSAGAACHGCSYCSGEVAEFCGGQCGRAGIPCSAVEAAVKAVFEQIGILGCAAADDNPVGPEDGQERRQADSDSLAVGVENLRGRRVAASGFSCEFIDLAGG
jgi:tetratricopeptide (TPR) repeat protein